MINPYEQYKKTAITTMTKGELLILLFDEAIKKLNLSKILMEQNNYETANINLSKTRQIFNHLIVTLDDSYAVSSELRDMYMFFNSQLIKATSFKSVKYIDEILPLVKDLKDTWVEADKIARNAKS